MKYDEVRTLLREKMDLLQKGVIPETYMDVGLHCDMIDTQLIKMRTEFTNTFGFALVANDWNRELVNSVIKTGKCLEVMAGKGMWTKALRGLGIEVISTDDMSWEDTHNPLWKDHVIDDMIKMDAVTAVRTYGNDVDFVLMSWPYMDNTAYRVLQNMRIVNPKLRLIYIGEGETGCCANDYFFESMDEVFTSGMQDVNQKYCRFPGLHDRVYLIK